LDCLAVLNATQHYRYTPTGQARTPHAVLVYHRPTFYSVRRLPRLPRAFSSLQRFPDVRIDEHPTAAGRSGNGLPDERSGSGTTPTPANYLPKQPPHHLRTRTGGRSAKPDCCTHFRCLNARAWTVHRGGYHGYPFPPDRWTGFGTRTSPHYHHRLLVGWIQADCASIPGIFRCYLDGCRGAVPAVLFPFPSAGPSHTIPDVPPPTVHYNVTHLPTTLPCRTAGLVLHSAIFPLVYSKTFSGRAAPHLPRDHAHYLHVVPSTFPRDEQPHTTRYLARGVYWLGAEYELAAWMVVQTWICNLHSA